MLKKLFPTPADISRTSNHTVYTETLGVLNATLLPIGFELVQESHGGLGALALFKKGNLGARLFLDLRDDICVFSAKSGGVRTWTNPHGEEKNSKYDLYLYLSEPDNRERFPSELGRWLKEHDSH